MSNTAKMVPFVVVTMLLFVVPDLHSRKADQQRKIPEVATSGGVRNRSDLPLKHHATHWTAAHDTTVLAEFDFGSSAADPQGWVSVDLTMQPDTFFHVDDFAGLGGGSFGRLAPLEGSQSLWCGARPVSDVIRCSYAALPGYGNDWVQWFESAPFVTSGNVTISYLASWDMEAPYDEGIFEYKHIDNGWTAARTYTGIGQTLESITIPGASVGGTLRLRFVFHSDGEWSDEDGLWDTDGAMIIDSLTVSDTTGEIDFQDFETETVGSLTTVDGDWRANVPEPFGDFAALHAGFEVVQEDPCIANMFLWGFFADPAVENYSCHTPDPLPAQGAVPFGNERGQFLSNEIWSPAILFAGVGSGNEVNLTFDVYRDLPLDNLIFYTWRIRSWVAGCPGPWRDRNSLYRGGDRDWITTAWSVGDLIDPAADSIQVAIGAVDMCDSWCDIFGTGACHSHAPLIDNVKLTRVATTGPLWFVRDIELFQDSFVQRQGHAPGPNVPVDIALDTLPNSVGSILPGDSAVVTASEPDLGLATDPNTGTGPAVYAHVAVWPQDQPGKGGSDIEAPESRGSVGTRFPYLGSTVAPDGTTWDLFRMDSVVTAFGSVVEDRFCMDLSDDVFTPGDTICFYFSARDAGGITSYWSRYTGPTTSETEVQTAPMEMTCLPANALNGATDILYVDDYDHLGAQPYFDAAFEALGVTPDRYDVRGSTSLVNNGPDSRIASVVTQLIPYYRVVIWNSGDATVGTIGDGTGGPTGGLLKEDDFGLLYTFLDQHPDSAGVYISGDGIAEEWVALVGASAVGLAGDYMNFNLLSDNHQVYVGVSPRVVGQPGSIFYHSGEADSLIAFGGCPSIKRFDILQQSAASSVGGAYENNPAYGAVLTQETANSLGNKVRVALSGISYHSIRGGNSPVPAYVEHLGDILGWFQGISAVTPNCNVEPTSLDFDSVAVWSYSDRNFTITNTSGEPLSGTIGAPCSHYHIVSGGAYNIGPGQTDTVTVRFQPTALGVHNCTIDTGSLLCGDVLCAGVGVRVLCGFSEQAVAYGVAGSGSARGVAWGDYNNDGLLDLYVAHFGPANTLYRNDGGSFTEIGSAQGVADVGKGVGVAWGDYNNDGRLDLYVSNGNTANRLYRNDGGSFTEVGSDQGVADTGNGTGVAWGDYNNDGLLDLYVANHNTANRLYRNDGGSFTEVGSSLGVDDVGGSQGLDWGDFNNDGLLDLYVTNFGTANRLYRNEGGSFTEVGSAQGVADEGQGTGVAWGDYNNDGRLDLYVTNYNSTNCLYRNDGGSFTEVAVIECVHDPARGQGLGWGDYNNDGLLDLYEANSDTSNRLYQNDTVTGNHWLKVDLVGTLSSANGIGARVRVVTDDVVQIREISGGAGLYSQSSLTAEFGLGSTTLADTVEVKWPSGTVDDTVNVAVDRRIIIQEGWGIVTGVQDDIETRMLDRFVLYQNVPNPFNPTTRISFALPSRAHTMLSIYNIEGKLVTTLVDETLGAGFKEITWHGRDARGNQVSTGVYFYRLTAGNRTLTKKMVLLK